MEKLKHNFKYGAVLTILFSVILLVLTTIRWFNDNILIFPMIIGIIFVFFSSKIIGFFSRQIKSYESKYFHKLLKKLEKYILAFIILIIAIFSIMFVFGLYRIPSILLPFKKIFITILMGLIVVSLINLVEDIIVHKKNIFSNIRENIVLFSVNLIILVLMFFSAFNYSLVSYELQGELITGVIIFIISMTTLAIKIEDHRSNYKKVSYFQEKNIENFQEGVKDFLFFTESFFVENENKKEKLPSLYKAVISIDLILDISKLKERELSKKINEFYKIISSSSDYFNIGKVKMKDSQMKANIIGSNVNIGFRDKVIDKLEDIKRDFRIYIKIYQVKGSYTDLEFSKKWLEIEGELKK